MRKYNSARCIFLVVAHDSTDRRCISILVTNGYYCSAVSFFGPNFEICYLDFQVNHAKRSAWIRNVVLVLNKKHAKIMRLAIWNIGIRKPRN